MAGQICVQFCFPQGTGFAKSGYTNTLESVTGDFTQLAEVRLSCVPDFLHSVPGINEGKNPKLFIRDGQGGWWGWHKGFEARAEYVATT